MAEYADLTPCDYITPNHDSKLIAVGWLARGVDYSKGDVPQDLFARIHQMLVAPWQPFIAMGAHACDFCRFSGGPSQLTLDNVTVQLGISNIFIPYGEQLFVAPSLIVHYIDAHEYSPPAEFCDAVLACPEMRSMDYLKLIRKTAPPAFFSGNKSAR